MDTLQYRRAILDIQSWYIPTQIFAFRPGKHSRPIPTRPVRIRNTLFVYQYILQAVAVFGNLPLLWRADSALGLGPHRTPGEKQRQGPENSIIILPHWIHIPTKQVVFLLVSFLCSVSVGE